MARLSPEAARRKVDAATAGRAAVVLALSLAYLSYVFRVPTGEWRRLGLGDWIDPYFINSLLEGWRYSIAHLKSPASPPVFFPVRGTLGYSHTLVFYAPVYVISRIWLDPLTAYTLTLFATIELGVIALYVLLRRFVGVTFTEALVFSALFVTSANVINGSTGVWSQRASVFLIPAILLVGFRAGDHAPGARRWLGLAFSGLLAASLLTQDIYTGLLTALIGGLLLVGARIILGWPRFGIRITLRRRAPLHVSGARANASRAFLLVAAVAIVWAAVNRFGNARHHNWGRALIAAAVALVISEILRGGIRDRIAIVDRTTAFDRAAFAVGALAGLGVFVWIYAEAFSQHHGFPRQELLEHLRPATWMPFDSGRSCVIALVLALGAWIPWLRLPLRVRLCAAWFLVVTAIALLIPIRFGDIAIWAYADSLPGFSAIRDPRRIQYPFELATALAVALFVTQFPRNSGVRRVVTLFVLALVVATWNRQRFDYERPFDTFRTYVGTPIAIDRSCRSFFVAPARSDAYLSRSINMWALYANDAAFIALAHGIPTLNGYSAWAPPDWHLFNPQDADYMDGVARWVALNRLDNVCQLDIERRTMTPYK